MHDAVIAKAGNLLTIDLEDQYQLVGDQLCGADTPRPEKMEQQVVRLLELLRKHNCRATFFCLGRSIEKSPHIVKMVADAGHEIGTHGWRHGLIFKIGLDAFRDDLRRSIEFLQNLTGKRVLGHRAPAFSIRPEQLERFYDICFDAGLLYDSSVFPIKGRRYGIPDAPRNAFVARRDGARVLIELPLATVVIGGRRLPVAGGGWWRILPTGMLQAAVAHIEREGLPFVTYFHPHEFDTERLNTVSVAGRTLRAYKLALTQNVGRLTIHGKLDAVLGKRRFMAVEDYLRDAGFI